MEKKTLADYPELVKQCHPTKNKIDPKTLTHGSREKIWWQCKNGHEWQAQIYSRVRRGHGCRKCYAERQGEMRKKLSVSKVGSIADTNPELAKQWHPKKNTFSPDQLSKGSNTPIWWICEKGHEWKAAPKARTRNYALDKSGHVRKGFGCPWCANKPYFVTPRESLHNFFKTNPSLAKQWHPDKNTIDPKMISCGSSKRGWWICIKGHEWPTAVSQRTNKDRLSGCPRCKSQSGQLELRIYSELITLFELKHREKIGKKRDEIDVYIPKYKIGIEIDGYLHKLNHKRDVLKHKRIEEYDIKLIHLRDESLESITERDIFYNEQKKHLPSLLKLLRLISSIGKLDKADSKKIRSYLDKRIYVNEKLYFKLIAEKSIPVTPVSFLDKFGDVAKEHWDYEKNEPLKPEYFTVNSIIIVWWKCKNGHEWKQKLHEVARNAKVSSQICKYCSGHRLLQGNNSIDITHPELLTEWDFDKNKIKPEQITSISDKKVWWKCIECSNEWNTFVYRRSNGKGCPKCSVKIRGKSRRLLDAQKNPFSTQYPELVKEWHPTLNDLTPDNVAAGSDYRAWWICEDGHEWQAPIHSRTKKKTGCKTCWYEKNLKTKIRKSRVRNVGSVADTHPWLVPEWHPKKNGNIDPSTVTQGSTEIIWWVCNNGHKDYPQRLNTRTRSKTPSGCPECGLVKQGQKYVQLMIKKNGSLKEKFPRVAKEWHPDKNKELTPDAVTSKASKKVWWLCKNGHEWQANIQNRTTNQSGCPDCYKNRITRN